MGAGTETQFPCQNATSEEAATPGGRFPHVVAPQTRQPAPARCPVEEPDLQEVGLVDLFQGLRVFPTAAASVETPAGPPSGRRRREMWSLVR
jgi:hypothetical protein